VKNIHISEMRAFNRYYTSVIGILNKNFLNSKFTLTEIRVLQAMRFREGITASEIIAVLNIDKSYLSRIILRLEKKKLISKKVSPEDGRSSSLYLTGAGEQEFEIVDAATHNQVKQILSQLSEKDCKNLIACMTQIKKILSKPALSKK
jgi:DNA-binding MarR family transcriptional regulator